MPLVRCHHDSETLTLGDGLSSALILHPQSVFMRASPRPSYPNFAVVAPRGGPCGRWLPPRGRCFGTGPRTTFAQSGAVVLVLVLQKR